MAFQSHYGAIATVYSPRVWGAREDAFNPTMVRLQLVLIDTDTTLKSNFQSHYGAIATRPCHSYPQRWQSFQSHYGAIATSPIASCSGRVAKTFNPTMVRLQLVPGTFHYFYGNNFQSHYGAIATHIGLNERKRAWPFNPTMVRLQPKKGGDGRWSKWELSIPLWCDCNITSSKCCLCCYWLSIPLWCDCNLCILRADDVNEAAFNPTMVRLQQC